MSILSSISTSTPLFTPEELGFSPISFPSFRPQQISTITQIIEAFDSTSTVLLCAPPGCGKSLIYNAVSRILGGRSLTLVINKGLQSQLLSDFPESYSIVGHSNYPCANVLRSTSGDIDEFDCDARQSNRTCYYQEAIDTSLTHQSIITNVAHRVTIARSDSPDRLGNFSLLIGDEAHSIRDTLCSLLSVKIYPRRISQLLGFTSTLSTPSVSDGLGVWVDWARVVVDRCERVGMGMGKSGSADGKYARSLSRDLTRFIDGVQLDPRWLAREETPTHASPYISIQPRWAEKFTPTYLFYGVEKVILCSATLTHDTARHLGLDRSQYTLLDLDSTFDVRRRPFISLSVCKVDYQMSADDMRILVGAGDEIIGARQDRKLIGHPVSYDRARTIKSLSLYASQIITHDRSSELPDAIRRHTASPPPSTLLSPSISTGYDFKGDLARASIMYKVPRADSRDPLIKARRKDDKGFDRGEVIQSIVQSYGRVMRSMSDWGETFMLDRYMDFLPASLFPMYFRRAWRSVEYIKGRIPGPINF
jgi:Rad3-related DNA helicase